MSREIIFTENAPEPVGTYSQAIKSNGFLYVSGQIPINPSTGKLIETDFENMARQVLHNIQAIVEAAGMNLTNIIKMNVYLTDLSNFATVNSVFSDFFESDPPARAAVEVSALPLGTEIEIECIAAE